jgi:acyl-CoA thioesterase-1
MNDLAHTFTVRWSLRQVLRLLSPRVVQMVAAVVLFNLSAGGAMAGDAVKPIRIVAFGDSLTAGYGLAPNDAFPVQLERVLRAKGYNIEIVNAGVSGDTTGGGLARFDWAIPDGTDAVILELGANDALRGIDPELTRKALDQILAKLKARNIKVLIAGMKAPSNWGADYVAKFDPIFPELAAKYGAKLYPFFLAGIAQRQDLNQSDGLHPTAKGVGEIVNRILPATEQLIATVTAAQPAGGPSKF